MISAAISGANEEFSNQFWAGLCLFEIGLVSYCTIVGNPAFFQALRPPYKTVTLVLPL
jgi:hypothetical protein